MTPDEAIVIVDGKARGRTRYEDQHDFLDEVLVKEIKSLRKKIDGLKEALDECDDDPWMDEEEWDAYWDENDNGWDDFDGSCCDDDFEYY